MRDVQCFKTSFSSVETAVGVLEPGVSGTFSIRILECLIVPSMSRHLAHSLVTSVSRFPTLVSSEATLSEHDESPCSTSDIVVFIVSTSERIAAVLFATSVLTACSSYLTVSNSSTRNVFSSDLINALMSFFSDVRISTFRSTVSMLSYGWGEPLLLPVDVTLELAALGPAVEVPPVNLYFHKLLAIGTAISILN